MHRNPAVLPSRGDYTLWQQGDPDTRGYTAENRIDRTEFQRLRNSIPALFNRLSSLFDMSNQRGAMVFSSLIDVRSSCLELSEESPDKLFAKGVLLLQIWMVDRTRNKRAFKSAFNNVLDQTTGRSVVTTGGPSGRPS